MDAATKTSDRPNTGQRTGQRAGRLILSMIIAALIAAGGILLARHELLFVDTIDRFLGDWRTAALSPRAPAQRSDIAVVLITEETLLDYPARSPIDRGLMADLITTIDGAGPKAIGLDLIFDRNSAHDAKFMAALDRARSPIILGAIDERIAVPPQSLAIQKKFLRRIGKPVGHLMFLREKGKLTGFDNAVRLLAPPPPDHPERLAFSTLLARSASGPAGSAAPEPTKSLVGKLTTKRTISWLLPPADDTQPLFLTLKIPQHKPGDRSASLNQIFPQSWRDLLRGRIVLIGGGMLDMDGHITPLSIRDGRPIPGVYIHAQALAQQLDGNRDIRRLPGLWALLAVFAVAFICFQLGRYWNVRRFEKTFQFTGLIILGLISLGAFWLFRLTIPSGAMTFAWLVGAIAGHYSSPIFRRLGLQS